MNYLKTTDLGGFPFVLDDLRFADAAWRKALADAIIGLNGGVLNCIVLGMEITGPGVNENVAAGLVLLDGELLQVDAHTVGTIGLADFQEILISETFDPAGTKTFEDAGVHETYVKRRAYLNAGFNPVPPGTVIFRNNGGYLFKRLPAAILGELDSFFKNWGFIAGASVTGLPVDFAYWTGGGGISSKKTGNHARVNIDFRVIHTGATTPNTITFNGPANIDVSAATFLGIGQAQSVACRFMMDPGGEIRVEKLDGTDFTSGAPYDISLTSGDFPCII